VVTGAARRIERAIAVEFAANGADVVALDIAGPVSPASDAVPATMDLADTERQITAYGRRAQTVRADIRDIQALRAPTRWSAIMARSTSSSPTRPSSVGSRCWTWRTPTGGT
jgi:NAD(P)-dependent dehydrogenase (short-subunit alcohol dehydrogenase family)